MMLTKGLQKALSVAGRNKISLAVGAGVLGGSLIGSAKASDDAIPPPAYSWSHKGAFSSFDAASMRRGYEVYRQVCSTCHAMNFLCYRNLVGTTHTKEHAEMLAGSIEVKDGPNDEGEMFDRPGKLFDRFPAPYPNEEAARAANGGAYPPDLSMIVKARPHGEDYVFALLTGYKESPAGVQLRPGLHYNPYFSGGAISMEAPLKEFGQVEWQDGTPPTVTQMAKDVSTFLAWASEPETDDRKKAGVKWITALLAATALAGYWKRFKWMPIKTRKIEYRSY
eukprot:CAMPEP_0114504936 /NCGR_PEP_ID=MMETSP0109-20121206/10560_1 /TAXON_ID=29199 /ORGANISM="Chlorarachnion reptans, Strain CCCM449" /LENGTH=279 /DNA_ID=CAMNT_0001683291 /DNA_START=107 /DNA_END=946 /DNA_ORIENTATION=+